MRRTKLLGALLTVLLVLSACTGGAERAEKIEPMTKEAVEGTELYRLTLTPRAVERLDVQTAEVGSEASRLVMPYGALIYDLYGDTWTYVNPEPRVYVREPVVIDHIRDDGVVVLHDGPDVGTKVVSVAAAELYGAETGIGK